MSHQKKNSTPKGDEVAGSDAVFNVERIIAKRKMGGKTQYLVKWEGFQTIYNSWEPEANFVSRDVIDIYEEEVRMKRMAAEKLRQPKPAKKEILTENQCKSILERKSRDFAFKTDGRKSKRQRRPDSAGDSRRSETLTPTPSPTPTPTPPSRKVPRKVEAKKASSDDERPKSVSNRDDEDAAAASYTVKPVNGFVRGLVPESIAGGCRKFGEPHLLIKWKGGHESELLPSRVVYEYDPKLACHFFESKIIWID